MSHFILTLIIFFLGSIIGSFLNVVILRYRSGRTLGGRSMCFSCGTTLSWAELIPIGSFLAQRGRCGSCQSRISPQYPIVEALTGILFVSIFWKFEKLLFVDPKTFSILFVYYAIIFSILVVLATYDVLHKILPDRFTILFAVVAGLGLFFVTGDTVALHTPSLQAIIAGLIIPAPFAFLWLVSKGKWMGFGDAKLSIGTGLLLGLSAGIASVLLAFWIGAFYGVLHIVWSRIRGHKHISLKSTIPFGPFLILGACIVFFSGLDLASLSVLVNSLFL